MGADEIGTTQRPRRMRPVVDVDFTTAQHAALRMLAACPEQPLSDHESEEIVVSMRRLPPGASHD